MTPKNPDAPNPPKIATMGLPTLRGHIDPIGHGPGIHTKRLPQPEHINAWIDIRNMMSQRFKAIFEKINDHPDFVCDQPGQKSLTLQIQVPWSANEVQQVRLINRMNEDLELVQELQFGRDPQRPYCIRMHKESFNLIPPEDIPSFYQDNLQTVMAMGWKTSNNTTFWDELERALDAPRPNADVQWSR